MIKVSIEVVVNDVTHTFNKEIDFQSHGYSHDSDITKADALLAEGYTKIQKSVESQR
jgi:hypothetical protein